MKPGSILIIDDEPTVLSTTRLVLKLAGFAVLTAGSAEQALAIWEAQKQDIALIIADFDLGPGITGSELAAHLASDKPGLKTILLSAYPLDSRFEGRTEGVDFIQKPYDAKNLIEAIKGQLSMGD